MEYDFYNFYSLEFEKIIQALFQEITGIKSLVFGFGKDGKRELTYNGFFNIKNEIFNGYSIVQAKFKSRDFLKENDYNWIRKNLKSELEKVIKLEKIPDNYFFVTNAVLTPVEEIGGRDKVEKFKQEYLNFIPNIIIIGYDELCRLLDNNPNVRTAYGLSTNGDKLDVLLKYISNNLNVKKENFRIIDNEIREKNITNLPTEKKNPIVGIDFGSSNSLCAIYKEADGVSIIFSDKGKQLVSTCITFFDNGYFIIGKPEYSLITDTVTISNFKKEIGRNKEYKVFDKIYSAEELTVLFLKSLKLNIENSLNVQMYRILIARPVNFSLTQNELLIDCFNKAGFNIFRSISESSLASLNIVNEKYDDFFVSLVLDIGGGTVDVAVVDCGDDLYEIMAIFGDNYLGGCDFDNAIYDYCKENFSNRNLILSEQEQVFIKYESERIKKELTNSDFSILILRDKETGVGNLVDYEIIITKSIFRKITTKLNESIQRIVQQAQKVNDRTSKFAAIYLCGQGCKIFTIRELIEKEFPNIPIVDIFKENAVINGLAEYSDVLSKVNVKVNKLLLDTIGYMVGIKCKELGNSIGYDIISVEQDENIYTTTLIENIATIPTKKTDKYIIENKKSLKNMTLNFVIFNQPDNFWNNLQSYDLKASEIIETITITVVVDVNTTIKAYVGYNDRGENNEILLNKFL